jgi:LmbE family N-acetylglucosaminyl deacetylase
VEVARKKNKDALMLNLDSCKNKKGSGYRILCLGSHCDDIEIGCGGTILRLLEKYRNSKILWVVFSSDQRRAREAFKSANVFLRCAKEKNVVIKDFKTSFFPFIGSEIKECFEELKEEFIPDLIFTHYRNDAHQDHRLISELTWNTYRDHLILEYEIPKYDGDLGSPNFFVHLDDSICRRKIKYILSSFKSQSGNHWFTDGTFESMLRLRGIESNAPDEFAEAFYCRKIVFLGT